MASFGLVQVRTLSLHLFSASTRYLCRAQTVWVSTQPSCPLSASCDALLCPAVCQFHLGLEVYSSGATCFLILRESVLVIKIHHCITVQHHKCS